MHAQVTFLQVTVSLTNEMKGVETISLQRETFG